MPEIRPYRHGTTRPHRNFPEGHITQFLHHGFGVIGFANAHAAACDDGVGL